MSVARELDAMGVSECPHCAAGSPVRFGHASGLQRNKCHACRRTFNVLTGTPLARLRHRTAWRVFAQALIDGEAVRASAKRAGVHRNTAFCWRHRFLAAPAAMQAKRLTGIAEADETVMRLSSKGSRSLDRPPRKRSGGARKSRKGRDPDDEVGVLVMQDREGHTLSDALATVDHATIDNTVDHRLDREAVHRWRARLPALRPISGDRSRTRQPRPGHPRPAIGVLRPERQRLPQPLESADGTLPRHGYALPEPLPRLASHARHDRRGHRARSRAHGRLRSDYQHSAMTWPYELTRHGRSRRRGMRTA